MKKKIVSLMLVAAMSVSLCACGGGKEAGEEAPAGTEQAVGTEEGAVNEGPDMEAYGAESAELYDKVLGEFKAEYDKALEAESVSERYALMAVAEAKLMESAVMLPTTSKGGRYGITHVAPYSTDYVLWGSDQTRFHSAIVCNELIKDTDILAMKAKWEELKGTGTYHDWAKQYLTDQGYTFADTYSYPYVGDPETWDVLASSRAATNEPLSQCVDGLLEYDCEGVLQPALAESYTVSDDGLTYTFKLRQGVQWVDSQGQPIAELTAQDFVSGFQHMMDTQSGLETIPSEDVVGVDKYLAGEAGMDQVGVKAVDDYTVEYTLVQPCSYFLTTLEYSAYQPLCTSFYESKGGKFGAEYDATCQYGQTKDDIAYCGPFTVSSATAEKEMKFVKNEHYYDPSKVNVDYINFIYESGEDPTKVYEDVKSGLVSSCALTTETVEIAKSEGLFDSDEVTISSTDATSYMAFLNINRYATANTNDTTTVVSGRDEADIAQTTKAFQNVHIRRAICTALDRKVWNAQKVGDELADKNLINTYTPGHFVSLEEAVTVDGLGEFPAGTYFGQIVQAQLDADGMEIKVWRDGQASAVDSCSGFDGWYNPEFAAAELAKGIEELKAEGVEISAENPITFDLPYASNLPTYTNLANAFKQSVENTLGDCVKVNLVSCANENEWQYAGYYTNYGWEANYDVYDLAGWSPDYGDPSTYLKTFLPDYSGYMIKCIGIY